jgi:hypothetical protein
MPKSSGSGTTPALRATLLTQEGSSRTCDVIKYLLEKPYAM